MTYPDDQFGTGGQPTGTHLIDAANTLSDEQAAKIADPHAASTARLWRRLARKRQEQIDDCVRRIAAQRAAREAYAKQPLPMVTQADARSKPERRSIIKGIILSIRLTALICGLVVFA